MSLPEVNAESSNTKMSLPEVNAESSSVSANVPTFLSYEEQNKCTIPESPKVLDLSSVARIKNHQIPVGMETEVTDSDGDLNKEKSSYEIAAEALCLMKSGGLVSLDGKRDRNTEENVNAQTHFCNSDVKYTVASHFDTEVHLEPKLAKEFHMNVKTIESSSRSENVLSAINFVNSDTQVEINDSPVIMNVSSESSSSSVLQSSSFTATPLHMSSTVSANSSQPIKYVIVPESTLLSMVKPRDSVSVDSVPGTQYYFLMPTEKQPATKVISIPRLQSLNQDNVPQDCKPSLFDVSKNTAATSSASVNISKNAAFSEESLQNNRNCESSALNVRSTVGRRSMMKKHDTLKFPPCIICEGEASGFHYGCNTCEACKNFFRRCLLRKSDMPFICHSSKTCEISFKKNKNNCSACRLDKCLEMGMAKEKCKMGRYTALMRTETIKKVRKLEGKDEDNAETSSVDSPGPNAVQLDETYQSSDTSSLLEHVENKDICAEIISKQIFTTENELPTNGNKTEFNERLIHYLVSAMENIKPWGENLVTEEARKTRTKEHYEKYKARKARVQAFSLNDLPGHENQKILKQYKMDEDGQLDLLKKWRFDWETVVGRYCSFAKCIPEFRSLCYSDQTNLLKATHFDFFTIILHQGYFPEYGVFLEINGEPYHVEEAANQFFTRDFVFLMVDMMSRLQKLNLSKSEMALLISIITLSSDQCELVNSKLVEDTQLRLVELLLKELCKVYGQSGGSKRLTSFIDAITRMREVSSVYFKEYRTLCNNDYKKESVLDLDVTLSEEHI